MPPSNEKVWATVEKGEKLPSGKHRVTCKNCRAVFVGGGSKIAGHVAGGDMARRANVKPCGKADRGLRAELTGED